jgi:hypothetical protein
MAMQHRADSTRSYNANRGPKTPAPMRAKSNLKRNAKRAVNRA